MSPKNSSKAGKSSSTLTPVAKREKIIQELLHPYLPEIHPADVSGFADLCRQFLLDGFHPDLIQDMLWELHSRRDGQDFCYTVGIGRVQ